MPFGFDSFGKSLMVIGAILIIVGVILHFGDKLLGLGRLPGDIRIEKEGFSFYFPVVTSILLSVIVTIILNIIGRR